MIFRGRIAAPTMKSMKSKKDLKREVKEGLGRGDREEARAGGTPPQGAAAISDQLDRDLKSGRVEQMYKLQMEDVRGPFTTWEHGRTPKDAVKNARARRGAPDWVWNVTPCVQPVTWGLEIKYAPTDPAARASWNEAHLARSNPQKPERKWTPLSLSGEDKENLGKIGDLFESDRKIVRKILGSPNQQLPMSEVQKLEDLLLEVGPSRKFDSVRGTIKKVCANQHLMHIRNLRQSWQESQ